MMKYLSQLYFLSIFSLSTPFLFSQENQDYFKLHSGALPVKIFVGNAAKPGSLLGVDGQKRYNIRPNGRCWQNAARIKGFGKAKY